MLLTFQQVEPLFSDRQQEGESPAVPETHGHLGVERVHRIMGQVLRTHVMYIPNFWLLCERDFGGFKRLQQTTDFIDTEIFGKLKL